ncbi:hypothetical protein PLCT2_02115 [Planctomycetaceae bacterium]|nr:hypothetical protein PLCT2_02115 [Planctomycetaceae bacterium]
MMMARDDDAELLRWLHDCKMLSLRLDAADRNTRTLILLIECPTDLGLPAWNGRRATIVVHDLMDMNYAFHGNQIGAESIDGWDQRKPSAAECEKYGRDCRKYALGFCTGSEIELICKSVTVERGSE